MIDALQSLNSLILLIWVLILSSRLARVEKWRDRKEPNEWWD